MRLVTVAISSNAVFNAELMQVPDRTRL